MAYDFIPADSDHIHWGDAIDDHDIDWTVSLWVWADGAVNEGYIVNHWNANTGWLLRRQSGDPADIGVIINGTQVAVSESNSFITDQWVNLTITFDDSGSDGSCISRIYQNNSEIASHTTGPRVDANANNFSLGNRDDLARDFDGKLCELAWWRGTLLSSDQRQTLTNRYSPKFINPLPDFYAPCIRDLRDVIGGNAATNVNTAAADPHPPIIYPAPPFISFPSAAPPVGISIPVAMRTYRNLRL